MTKYTIKYEYYSWEESCGCCSDSSSELTVYNNGSVIVEEWCTIMEDEDELREYIVDKYPEYTEFVVHEDTRWF